MGYDVGAPIVIRGHEMSHSTPEWTGKSRYSIVNVCQTFPRMLHLKKQQAQGNLPTDPEELELVKDKGKGRKKEGGKGDEHKDERGAEHEDLSGEPSDVHTWGKEEQEGVSAAESQALGRNIAGKKRALDDSAVAAASPPTNKRVKGRSTNAKRSKASPASPLTSKSSKARSTETKRILERVERFKYLWARYKRYYEEVSELPDDAPIKQSRFDMVMTMHESLTAMKAEIIEEVLQR